MERVETKLREAIEHCSLSANSRDAAIYAVFSGGKRIRARLLLALNRDLTGLKSEAQSNRIIECAAAVELLHCASLVHDDLPALDNDLLRRGQPTVHAKFGAGVATLVGDLLTALAFSFSSVAAPLLAKAFVDLCDGQVLDIDNAAHSSDELIATHTKKTGALFAVSAELAALDSPHTCALEAQRLGELLGIEFQLKNDLDDALDDRGSEKPSDVRNRRGIGRSENESFVAPNLKELLTSFSAARNEQFQILQQVTKLELKATAGIIAEISGSFGTVNTYG